MSKSQILVTGSKGLIGTALKEALQADGFNVRGMDHAYPTTHSEYGDFQDTVLLKKFASECTGIVHLAGVSRVITGEKNPELCWKMNVEGTEKLLACAHTLPHRPWVIYASSREVYGQQVKLPVCENAPLSPLNIYAQSKAAAEKLVTYYRERELQTATLRFSNVYGSIYDHVDRVIPAFCRTAALGGTMRIDGGDNVFDFTHIRDVTQGIMKVIYALQAGTRDLPTLHLLTGQGSSLLQTAQLAQKASNKPIELVYACSRSFDVSTFYGDPTLANNLLGWKAKIQLAEGMQQLIQEYKNARIYQPSLDELIT